HKDELFYAVTRRAFDDAFGTVQVGAHAFIARAAHARTGGEVHDYVRTMLTKDLLCRTLTHVFGKGLHADRRIRPRTSITPANLVFAQQQAASTAAADRSADPCDQHLHVQPLVSGSSTPGIFRSIKSVGRAATPCSTMRCTVLRTRATISSTCSSGSSPVPS